MAAYWRQVQPQRLVVTGPAGAGKTVFALALILALLKDRADTDPVPVRIPVSLWDTTTPLDSFLAKRLMEAYRWPEEHAAALVEHGMILPVLDGLDEMDPTLPDGSPDTEAPRARAALEQLDGYRVRGEPGPVVLTCRTAHLQAMASRGVLRDSAQVTLAPVSHAQAMSYLATRAQDPPRWQPLIDHLTAHPTDALATLLSTPWRLCLVATVYHHDGSPHELTAYATAQALDDHLLSRFIPAATRLHPRTRFGRQRIYHPDQVHRWLHHLTHALIPAATPVPTGVRRARGRGSLGRRPTLRRRQSSGTDLILHQLWPLAGRARVRVVDALLTPCAVLLVSFLVWATLLRPMLGADLRVILYPTLIVGMSMVFPVEPVPRGRLRFSRPTTPISYRAWVMLLFSSLFLGAAAGAWSGPARGLLFGLLSGLVLFLLLELWRRSVAPPAKESRPWGLLKADLLLKIVAGVTVGLIFGGLIGLQPWFLPGFLPVMGIVPGLLLGQVWVLLWLMPSLLVMRLYVVFLLCSRGCLPFRLVVFLDWACEAGLLRYAGPAYQFRHRELQEWLTTH